MKNLSHSQLAAWKLFLRAHAVVLRKLEQHVQKEHKLPLSWFDVLPQLSLAAGRLRMTDLANSILVTSSGLCQVNKAEAALP